MRVSQQASVALLAAGTASAWVLPFPLPTAVTLPQLPTDLPTIPGFTLPGFTIPTWTKAATTTSSTKAATTTTSTKAVTTSSANSASVKTSSFVSGGSSVVSGSKPAGSSSVHITTSLSNSTASSLSSVKPTGTPSGPAADTTTLPTPYLPPGQTGTLQSPTCVNATSSGRTSAGSSLSSTKASGSMASSVKSPVGSSSSAKVPTGRPSSSAGLTTGGVTASSGSGSVAVSSKASGTASSSVNTTQVTSKGSLSSSRSEAPRTVTSSVKPTTTIATAVSSKPASGSSSKKASSVVSSLGSAMPSPSVGPSTYVNTTSGRLQCGTAPNVTGVTQCLGIPFAQPPVGNLRFAAPVAYTSSKTLDATKYGADCPATLENVPEGLGPRLYGLLGSLGQVGDTLAEDCLFLNVWMKTGTTTAKKPVLIWIYGGGFEFGGSAVDVYSGKYFAQDEDVVLVSLNYRVNILGFSGAPNATQNVGLLDQRLAVEWVRDNIAAFGGDPERITIFGQSAGGASTDLYRFAWTEDPIVQGFIPMSGTATSFAIRTADQGAVSWYQTTTAVGCGNSTTSTDDAILACMRNASVDAIEKAAAPNPGLSSLLGNFGPVIDDTVVFSNYTDLGVKGSFIQKPVLVGNANYEAGLFILIAAGAGESYPQSFWDYVDNSVFTCPASAAAHYASAYVPTWRYWYAGMYPNELIPTANISQAWHTSELPNLFGTTEEIERNAGATVAESANTQPQIALATYLRHAWVTFATDPTNGLAGSDFNWPQYDASGDNVVYLGKDNGTVAFYPASTINGPCS